MEKCVIYIYWDDKKYGILMKHMFHDIFEHKDDGCSCVSNAAF